MLENTSSPRVLFDEGVTESTVLTGILLLRADATGLFATTFGAVDTGMGLATNAI
jgi:hypothetical protein